MPFLEISERYHPLMDTPIQLMDSSYVSTLTLADRAYQHPHFGQHLRKQLPRFSFYFDGNERTVEYLGTDADTIGHMYELAFHAAKFIEAEDISLSERDHSALMLALLVHDMDETMHEQIRYTCGRVVGDVQCGSKTDEDRLAQKHIREMLYREVFSDVPPSLVRRVEAIIAHEDTSLLGEIFDICHELQSYETINNAEAVLRSGNYTRGDQTGLEEITTDSRALVLLRLRPHLGKFASVDNLILSEAESVA